MKIVIAHLYPELLNLYGDRGNITTMKNRLVWRGIEAEVREYTMADKIDFSDIDIAFLGGGSDREQRLVCDRLLTFRDDIKAFTDDGGSLVAVCGGYQLLGHYYCMGAETIKGLSLLDIYTNAGKKRLINNIIIDSEITGDYIVGFENHAGRTFINGCTPLGRVCYGKGNNGKDRTEGVISSNIIGTYIHGPLFPKNPALCDRVLSGALERKYGKTELIPLDDTLEMTARRYVIDRFYPSADAAKKI